MGPSLGPNDPQGGREARNSPELADTTKNQQRQGRDQHISTRGRGLPMRVGRGGTQIPSLDPCGLRGGDLQPATIYAQNPQTLWTTFWSCICPSPMILGRYPPLLLPWPCVIADRHILKHQENQTQNHLGLVYAIHEINAVPVIKL